MRTVFWCLSAIALVSMLGCSGGGSGSAVPAPQITLPGGGASVAFNQHITFQINVPSTTAATSAKGRRSATAATTPYVSTKTGSVLLILAEINGVSPQQAPPAIAPVNVPVSCQASTAGCVIPVKNIPAALGVNRYFVQTYVGINATGALISTGFVDVAVPATANPAIGGAAAALSIGGYVANIVLAPASLSVVLGVAQDQSVLVQALDAAGATIVGSALFVTPITVSVSDSANFSLNGATSVSVPGPLQKPLVLHYTGGQSFGTLVAAVSQDENGAAVNASQLPVNVLAPGSSPTPTVPVTPVPTSVPTSLPSVSPRPSSTPVPNGLSLYVADGQSDTISEYRFGTKIASGIYPNPVPTPDRVLQFSPLQLPPSILSGNSTSCAPAPQSSAQIGNGTGAVAVSAIGTIYLFPNCFDSNVDVNYVLGYPPNAVGSPVPTLVDPVPLNYNGVGQPEALYYNTAANALYVADYGSTDFITGFAAQNNGGAPLFNLGWNCYSEFHVRGGCFLSSPAGVAFDGNGYAYMPAFWIDTPTNGDAQSLTNPAALLTVATAGNNKNVAPFSAIAGLTSSIGGSQGAPAAAVVDGTTLYVLTGNQSLVSADGLSTYWPGVSSCPPPSANAPINSLATPDPNDALYTQCADLQQHYYLTAYQISSQLLGVGAYQQNVDLVPYFIMGGDTVGGFGCAFPIGNSEGGQYLAVSAGYVYVVNLAPQCNINGNPIISPEIDVYNTNGVTGVHTDIGPVYKLPLQSGLPTAVYLGPSGTATGGQALMKLRSQAFHLAQHRALESRYPRRARVQALPRRRAP